MRASPVQGVLGTQQQPQPPSSVMSTGSTFTAVNDDGKLRAVSTDPDVDGDLMSTPKPVHQHHQYKEDPFEPNPVLPAAPFVPGNSTSTVLVPPPPLLHPPLSNNNTTSMIPPPPDQLCYPPVPGSISFSVEAAPPPPPPPVMDRRKQFLVFVKILMKHLEKNAEDRIRLQAKRVLTECIAKNRQGDPEYTPLHIAAEARILPIVGPRHWNRSVQYLNLYLKKEAQKGSQQGQHSVTTAAI